MSVSAQLLKHHKLNLYRKCVEKKVNILIYIVKELQQMNLRFKNLVKLL